MSQADTQLAPEGEELSLDAIADAMAEEEQQPRQEAEVGEEEDAEEQQEAAQPDDDPEEEWEAAGQKYRVKRSELRAGYMKDADYRRKTAEVAEQRRAVEAAAQQVQQQRQFAATQLDVFLASLHKELVGSQPDPRLVDEDPQEFLRQQTAYNARAQQFQQAMQYRQALAAQEAQDRQRVMAETLKQEQEKLLEKMPELRDETKRTAAFSEVATFLQGLGYTQDELNGLTDHRALMVAMKAAKYDALQAAKAKQAKPDIPKPVRPGAASVQTPNSAKQKALDRLRRDPNDLDALSAAAFG